jgi:hypothetical protein
MLLAGYFYSEHSEKNREKQLDGVSRVALGHFNPLNGFSRVISEHKFNYQIQSLYLPIFGFSEGKSLAHYISIKEAVSFEEALRERAAGYDFFVFLPGHFHHAINKLRGNSLAAVIVIHIGTVDDDHAADCNGIGYFAD